MYNVGFPWEDVLAAVKFKFTNCVVILVKPIDLIEGNDSFPPEVGTLLFESMSGVKLSQEVTLLLWRERRGIK